MESLNESMFIDIYEIIESCNPSGTGYISYESIDFSYVDLVLIDLLMDMFT